MNNINEKTGISRLPISVLSGWSSQFVTAVSGFIIPRLIDSSLGSVQLGLWDFGWTIVVYFSLLQVGLVSSINRYVAKYNSNDDTLGVNIALSSVSFLLFCIGLAIFILTLFFSFALPYLFSGKLAGDTSAAQRIVFFLGCSLVAQIYGSPFGGLITGLHRWDIQQGINATGEILILISMSCVLLLGGNIVDLAITNLCCQIIRSFFRFFAAYKIYPMLSIKIAHIKYSAIKNMFNFGLKTSLPRMGEMVANATFNIFIIWFLGPMILAIYRRSKSLVRFIGTFTDRYAYVYTPTVSSLQSLNRHNELQKIFIQSHYYGISIILPFIILLSILGGNIVQIWMGIEYKNSILIAILAIGSFPSFLQLPTLSILRGFNAHGRPGFYQFFSMMTGLVLAGIGMKVFNTSLSTSCLILMLPTFLSDGLLIPYISLKRLDIRVGSYLNKSLLKPLLCNIPSIIFLSVFSMFYKSNSTFILVTSIMLAFILTLFLYFFFIIPNNLRRKIQKFILFPFSIFFRKTSI